MSGIRYEAVEKSFLHLLKETDLIRQVLNEQQPVSPSVLDSLAGQLAATVRQINKMMALIKSDPNPSAVVYESIKSEEAKAAGLRQKIEAEQGRLKAEAPTLALENYEDFCRRFAGRMERADYRQLIKSLLPSFVLSIVVKLGENRYEVRLKGATQAIEVYFSKSGWLFSPAPAWVLGRPVVEGSNIVGYYHHKLMNT
jgi:hypothetical protein